VSKYQVYARSANVHHQYPYLVFDCRGQLHLPLTVYAKEADSSLAAGTARKYIASTLRWFTWLDTDPWQVRAKHHWSDAPEAVRDYVREYLVRELHSRVDEHSPNYATVAADEQQFNPIRFLLAGLKRFYTMAKT
jgi:hypothetical protein